MSVRVISNDVSSNRGKLLNMPSSETTSEQINEKNENTYHPIVGQIMVTDEPEDKFDNVESSSR